MGISAPTTSPLVRRYSLGEFHALEAPPGGGHYELIAGVLYMVAAPALTHSLVASRLNLIFAAYAAAHPEHCTLLVPRAALWIPADTYLEPDLFLVATERLSRPDALATADLVVEVLSPGSAMYDRNTKADTYAALGVRELWLVDPERRTIEQRVLAGGGWTVVEIHADTATVDAVVFPGLRAIAAQVFAAA
jgi:Uma2 family endonuclease